MNVTREKIKVLVIEHDRMVHAVIAQLLAESTYWLFDPVFVNSFEQAVEEHEVHSSDVILLNLDLPGLEGIDNYRQLRQMIADLPIVVHTSNNDDEFIDSVLKAGAEDCIWRDHILRGPLLSRSLHYALNQWEMHEQLRKMAVYDELTGVMTRRFFFSKVNETISLSKRYHDPFVLCICDLDAFKEVNDTWGHLAGDNALIAFVEAIRATVRQTDTIGRIGGDEFCILFQRATGKEVLEVLQRLINSNIMFSLGESGGVGKVGASFGLVEFDEEFSSVKEMLDTADKMLYEVKRQGKGNVALYIPEKNK